MYPCDVCRQVFNTYDTYETHKCRVEFYAIQKQSDPNRPMLSRNSITPRNSSEPASLHGKRSKKPGKKEIIANYERYIQELKEYHAKELSILKKTMLENKSSLDLFREDNIQLKTKITEIISNTAVKDDNQQQLLKQVEQLRKTSEEQRTLIEQQQLQLQQERNRIEIGRAHV